MGSDVRVEWVMNMIVPGSSIQISTSATVARRTDVGGVIRWGVRFATPEPSIRQILRDYVEG